jgi:hypothetical protein
MVDPSSNENATEECKLEDMECGAHNNSDEHKMPDFSENIDAAEDPSPGLSSTFHKDDQVPAREVDQKSYTHQGLDMEVNAPPHLPVGLEQASVKLDEEDVISLVLDLEANPPFEFLQSQQPRLDKHGKDIEWYTMAWVALRECTMITALTLPHQLFQQLKM